MSKMKVLVFIFTVVHTIVYTSTAHQLVTIEETEDLFKKFVTHSLSENENTKLNDLFEILRRPEPVSSNEYRSNVRLSLDCIICRSALSALFEGVANSQPDDDLIDSVSTLCVALGIESETVCNGVVELNVPIINYIIRNEPQASPETFCGLFLQNAHNPNACAYSDPRFDWEVILPERPDTVPTPITDGRPLKIAVITDTHIDPLYEEYGVANCGEPTCCRKGQTPAERFFYKSNIDEALYRDSMVTENGEVKFNLSIASDIREQRWMTETRYTNRQSDAPAGYWGDYRNCDTPIRAFIDVIDRIAEDHQDIDVVYYVGDTIDHGVWETTYELINSVNRLLVEKMRSTFGDDVLIVPVIGNHEAQPTNQFAPSYITEPKLNTTWLYEALVDKWGHYLPQDAKESFLERGDFSVLVRPGLRAISINNNVAYRDNWWLAFDPLDAKRHLDWLVDELYKAELNGEYVHILAHIPPGVPDLTQSWTREYNRIVNRFSSIIKAEFNGHVHSDEFKIFYSLTDGSPINVAWGGGGATAYSNYNLNYKIIDFDTETYVPQNILSFVYNLTEANLTPHRRPHWFPLYDMKNIFQLEDLSPKSMNDLVYKMTSEKHFLDLYSAFFSKLSDNRWPWCGEDCKIDNMCKIVVTVLWEREKCEELTALYRAQTRN